MEEKKTIEQQDMQLQLRVKETEFSLTAVGQAKEEFALQQRAAQAMASSDIVPATYKGKVGNCLIAANIAKRLQADPLMVMQNLYIVHGQPAWSSKFLIATINASGKYSSLRYEFEGEEGTESRKCRAYAYEKADPTHERLYGDWVSIGMARQEGWLTKNGSKWMTMPELMLRYRAAAFWQRVYCPEISLGLMTEEEAKDSFAAYEEVQPSQVQAMTNDALSIIDAAMSKQDEATDDADDAVILQVEE